MYSYEVNTHHLSVQLYCNAVHNFAVSGWYLTFKLTRSIQINYRPTIHYNLSSFMGNLEILYFDLTNRIQWYQL